MRRGVLKNQRHLQSRDFIAFLRILKSIFPQACEKENATEWDWHSINTKGESKKKIISSMKFAKENDKEKKTFRKWNFDEDEAMLRRRICARISGIKKSLYYRQIPQDLD